MITALLVTMIVAALGVTVYALATHNVFSSAYDRKRVQAIAAAEAGIDSVYAQVQNNGPSYLQAYVCGNNAVTGSMPMSPTATYSVSVVYYGTFPPSGSPIPCGSLASTITTIQINNGTFSADITSAGTAVSGSSVNSVTRTMQSEVQLQPQTIFKQAIFSNGGFGSNNLNHFTLSGNNGANASIYTNADFACNNNTYIQGSVYAQGKASVASPCEIVADLWAGGDINAAGNTFSGKVDNNVNSSTGSLWMANGGNIGGNVKVAGTCNNCVGQVTGSIVAGSASRMPPRYPFPPLEWGTGTASDYQTQFQVAGYTVVNTDCATLSGMTTWGPNIAYRINGSCSFAKSTYTIAAPGSGADLGVAVVAGGSMTLSNQTTFQNQNACNAATQTCPFLSFIIPSNAVPGYTSSTPCPAPYDTNGAFDWTDNNNSNFTSLNTFLYTPCSVNMTNNNSNWCGQIYGGNQVNIANLDAQCYQPMPLFSAAAPITGFTENIAFLREIAS